MKSGQTLAFFRTYWWSKAKVFFSINPKSFSTWNWQSFVTLLSSTGISPSGIQVGFSMKSGKSITIFRTNWWSKAKVFFSFNPESFSPWNRQPFFTVLPSSRISPSSIQVGFLARKLGNQLQFSEPIGGAKPKFSLSTEGLILTRAALSPISLQCPAQGFPLPAFRLVNSVVKCLNFQIIRTHWWSKAKVLSWNK